MISIWKLIYELEYWIQIGIADDIVRSPASRPEYQHLVQEFKDAKVLNENIPSRVVVRLKQEAKLPFYKQPTFWHLVRLSIKRIFKR
ncbi:MAG: hypothetical protein ACXVB1_08930 [Pseudobdellovibrionaceae bacterium]